MTIADEIIRVRDCGVVHCGVSVVRHADILQLAEEFGLHGKREAFSEITATAARALIEQVLSRDLAYRAAVMSAERAAELAERFLPQFGDRAKYFSNGSCHGGWIPVTDATFDTGVLIIGTDCSGCLWVEDED
jgi:hypothetical protein